MSGGTRRGVRCFLPVIKQTAVTRTCPNETKRASKGGGRRAVNKRHRDAVSSRDYDYDSLYFSSRTQPATGPPPALVIHEPLGPSSFITSFITSSVLV